LGDRFLKNVEQHIRYAWWCDPWSSRLDAWVGRTHRFPLLKTELQKMRSALRGWKPLSIIGVEFPGQAPARLPLLSGRWRGDQNRQRAQGNCQRGSVLQEIAKLRPNTIWPNWSPGPTRMPAIWKNKLPFAWARMWWTISKRWPRKPESPIRALSTYIWEIARPPSANSSCNGHLRPRGCNPANRNLQLTHAKHWAFQLSAGGHSEATQTGPNQQGPGSNKSRKTLFSEVTEEGEGASQGYWICRCGAHSCWKLTMAAWTVTSRLHDTHQ